MKSGEMILVELGKYLASAKFEDAKLANAVTVMESISKLKGAACDTGLAFYHLRVHLS